MTKLLTTFAVAGVLGVAAAAAQSSADLEKHIAAAKAAAGTDHPGLFEQASSTAFAPRRGRSARLVVAERDVVEQTVPAAVEVAHLRLLLGRRGTPSPPRSSTTCITSG